MTLSDRLKVAKEIFPSRTLLQIVRAQVHAAEEAMQLQSCRLFTAEIARYGNSQQQSQLHKYAEDITEVTVWQYSPSKNIRKLSG